MSGASNRPSRCRFQTGRYGVAAVLCLDIVRVILALNWKTVINNEYRCTHDRTQRGKSVRLALLKAPRAYFCVYYEFIEMLWFR